MAHVEALLAVLPKIEHDKLFPLMAGAPAVYEKLTDRRPHRSLVWRHATKGVSGVKLRTVSVGGTLMTTARWVIEHWAAIDAERRKPTAKQRRKGKGGSRG